MSQAIQRLKKFGMLAWFCCVAACAGSTGPSAPELPRHAVTFRAYDLEGNLVTLGRYRGQVALVTVINTWADPALYEVPRLIKLHQTHKGRGFVVLCVVLDEQVTTVSVFRDAFDVPYPVVMPEDPEYFVSSDGPLGEIDLIPTSFLVDRRGVIAARMSGMWPPEVLERAVEELLAVDRSSE